MSEPNYGRAADLMRSAQLVAFISFYEHDNKINARSDFSLSGVSSSDIKVLAAELNAAIKPIVASWAKRFADEATSLVSDGE